MRSAKVDGLHAHLNGSSCFEPNWSTATRHQGVAWSAVLFLRASPELVPEAVRMVAFGAQPPR